MSTRATIACKQEDGLYAAIYLHFDGYPEHAGTILDLHYNELNAVRTLVAEGDIRCFESNGVVERFTNGNRPVTMPTRAALYDFSRNCSAEYVYVFENERWNCVKL